MAASDLTQPFLRISRVNSLPDKILSCFFCLPTEGFQSLSPALSSVNLGSRCSADPPLTYILRDVSKRLIRSSCARIRWHERTCRLLLSICHLSSSLNASFILHIFSHRYFSARLPEVLPLRPNKFPYEFYSSHSDGGTPRYTALLLLWKCRGVLLPISLRLQIFFSSLTSFFSVYTTLCSLTVSLVG